MSDQQLQKVKVRRLAHVGVWTDDVVAEARFYRQVLGFDLRKTVDISLEQDIDSEHANIFLALGDEHHSLGLFSDTRPTLSNGRQPVQRTRLHHLSFEVDNEAELAALAARLSQSGIQLTMEERDGSPDLGDTLWLNDPDGNRIEIAVTPEDSVLTVMGRRQSRLRPAQLQHVALQTARLETMVEFYTEALGFDISDWLLREYVWLRCNHDHHSLMLMQSSKTDVDHVGYSMFGGSEVLTWADHLSRYQTAILWGPGRHGAGNDLFLRITDPEGIHIELSAELQQYYDRDVTMPPRLWHTRPMALNLWGSMPSWMREEVKI